MHEVYQSRIGQRIQYTEIKLQHRKVKLKFWQFFSRYGSQRIITNMNSNNIIRNIGALQRDFIKTFKTNSDIF